MMPIFLSRLLIDPLDPSVRRDLADCQRMHRTIMRAFPLAPGGSARAEFGVLYRVDRGVRPGALTLYVQSLMEPDWSRLPPGYLIEAEDSHACRSLAEAYAAIVDGDRFTFRLRANVTRKIDTKSHDGQRRNGRRVELRREDDQLAWLNRQAERSGFVVLAATARPGRVAGIHPQGRLAFGSVYFLGQLQVTDCDLFRRALREGIGPAKAYGFGLLSLAPSPHGVGVNRSSISSLP